MSPQALSRPDRLSVSPRASGRSSSSSGRLATRSRRRGPALLRRGRGQPRLDHLPDHDRREHPCRELRYSDVRGRLGLPTSIDSLLREPGIGCCRSGRSATRDHVQRRQHRRRRRTARRGRLAAGRRQPGSGRPSSPRSTGAAPVNSVFNNWFEPACSPISPDTPSRRGQQRVPGVRPGARSSCSRRPASTPPCS